MTSKKWRIALTYLTIGRFTIPISLLSLIIAIFSVALLYKIMQKKSLDDWYWNSFFIMIGISKLSYILFNFQLFIDTPLSILYFDGGSKGLILGYITLAIYLSFIRINKSEFIHAFLLFLISYQGIQFAFEPNLIAAILHLALIGGYIGLSSRDNEYNPANSTQVFVLVILLEGIMLSLFGNVLSTENLLLIGLGLLIFILKKGDT